MKRKISAILIALTLALCLTVLVACGADKNKNPAPPAPVASEHPVKDRTVTETKLVTYEGPNLMQSSEDVSVSVNDEELFVYETRVNHNRTFSFGEPSTKNPVVIFDFEGKVKMKVEVKGTSAISDVVVRPLEYGVTPNINGNIAEFELEYPANYTFEFKKTSDENEVAADNALHIFANPIEEDPISSDSVPENTIYIGPGVYDAGAIPMTSGDTLYLAGGAYIYGQVRAELLENITIRGRGIISGEVYSRTKDSEYTLPIELRSCKNVKIEGISLFDPAGWAVTLYKCEGVDVDNLHIITARGNGDGISVQSCSDVEVKGGFVRTWDDSLVVKNVDRGTTDDVVFDGVTVWTDLAQSCEVGYETNGEIMRDITFKNITILHNYHKAALSIHNCDDAAITNVTYQNITVEQAFNRGDNQLQGTDDLFIDIVIAYNVNWTSSAGVRGTVDGVKIDNVKVIEFADTLQSHIMGDSNQCVVSNVAITNVTFGDKNVTDVAGLSLAAENYVSNVTVAGGNAASGSLFELPYKLKLQNDQVNSKNVPTHTQQGLEVPEFSILDITETYMGVKLDMADATVSVRHGHGTRTTDSLDADDVDFDNAQSPSSKLFDGDRNASFIAKDWTGEADEFIALTIDFGKSVLPGVMRLYLPESSVYVKEYTIKTFRYNESNDKYLAFGSTETVTVTPAKGNYVDFKLGSVTSGYTKLQLRFFRTEGLKAMDKLEIGEMKFYPNSLSTNKAILDASEHNDVYVASQLVDGNDNTYWEAKAKNATFTVDLGAVYTLKYIVMCLPPLLTWEARTQGIEILVSENGNDFETLVAKEDYLFDPMKGNNISIELPSGVRGRYVKLQWYSNQSNGNYGAQLSELYVYGE